MKSRKANLKKPTTWQQIFQQSKVNGAAYLGEQLPRSIWNWPKDTYLQRQLRRIRSYNLPGLSA